MKTLTTLLATLLLSYALHAQNDREQERVRLDTVPYTEVLEEENETEYYNSVRCCENSGVYIEIDEDGIRIGGHEDRDLPDYNRADIEKLSVEYKDILREIEASLEEINRDFSNYGSEDWDIVSDNLKSIKEDINTIEDFVCDNERRIKPDLGDQFCDVQDNYKSVYNEVKPQIKKARLKDVKTRWILMDLGYSIYNEASTAPRVEGIDPTELRLGKSVAVTLHIVQQRLNLVDHHLNLIYGAGLQFNTYAFDNPVQLLADQGDVTFEAYPDRSYRKNRLRANYLHVPVMLNYESNPGRKRKSFRLQAGAYMNILYSANFKTKIDGDKTKTKDNFNLNRFQPGIYGQVGYGPINFYLTYGLNGLFDEDENSGYDLTPIGFGIKLLPF